jgi:hypothetical protein
MMGTLVTLLGATLLALGVATVIINGVVFLAMATLVRFAARAWRSPPL